MSARLDAVAKAKKAYVLAKGSFEYELRQKMKKELLNLQTQIDIAVRYAVDAGESKADILRYLGTKSYNTLYESLERTAGVSEAVGVDPLDSVYTLEDDVLYVTYDSHGPNEYSGKATFNVKKIDTGGYLFFARDDSPLWSEDYTVRNDVVAALDGKNDGFYYDEVCEWLNQR